MLLSIIQEENAIHMPPSSVTPNLSLLNSLRTSVCARITSDNHTRRNRTRRILTERRPLKSRAIRSDCIIYVSITSTKFTQKGKLTSLHTDNSWVTIIPTADIVVSVGEDACVGVGVRNSIMPNLACVISSLEIKLPGDASASRLVEDAFRGLGVSPCSELICPHGSDGGDPEGGVRHSAGEVPSGAGAEADEAVGGRVGGGVRLAVKGDGLGKVDLAVCVVFVGVWGVAEAALRGAGEDEVV